MSSKKPSAKNFLNKNKAKSSLSIPSRPSNAFRSIFDIQALDEQESNQINKLLEDNFDSALGSRRGRLDSDIFCAKRYNS